MLGVFAEFERGIIRDRVDAGLARARQNGTKLGRRRVKPSVEATIRELRAEGDGILKIARTLGVGTSVVRRVVLESLKRGHSAGGAPPFESDVDRATATTKHPFGHKDPNTLKT